MDCPICGHKLEENAAFCTNCGGSLRSTEETAAPVSAPKPPKKVAERLYPPDPFQPAAQTEPGFDLRSVLSPDDSGDADRPDGAGEPDAPDGPKDAGSMGPQKKAGRGLKIFAVISCCLAVLAIAASAYIIFTSSSLRVQLNKAQKESSTAKANVESLGEQVAQLTEDLSAARTENDTLSVQVTDLQRQINEMETSVNQSLYDKEAAQRSMEEAQSQLTSAQEENESLQEQLTEAESALTEAQTEKETLEAEYSALQEKAEAYETEIGFYDTYVVFVMLSDTDKLYHKYSCPNFTGRNFLAYSTKLAEANGYAPCPTCIGTE